jgi:hypothetical protein
MMVFKKEKSFDELMSILIKVGQTTSPAEHALIYVDIMNYIQSIYNAGYEVGYVEATNHIMNDTTSNLN